MPSRPIAGSRQRDEGVVRLYAVEKAARLEEVGAYDSLPSKANPATMFSDIWSAALRKAAARRPTEFFSVTTLRKFSTRLSSAHSPLQPVKVGAHGPVAVQFARVGVENKPSPAATGFL